jgi:hypothetical protein
MDRDEDYSQYIGLRSDPRLSPTPLESDILRRFTQAIMDDDPLYYDESYAETTRHGGIVAPPLFPVHVFRRPSGTPDPLDQVRDDPDADGSAGVGGAQGLPPIPSPYKRLLNGGNDIEFHQCLRLGEKVISTAKYADVSLKDGKSGKMLLVVIETELRNERHELLLINRQTLIWR